MLFFSHNIRIYNTRVGSGKTTLTKQIQKSLSLSPHHLSLVCISIDDFYLTYEQQQRCAQTNSTNPLLKYRGNPGTHDIQLGYRILTKILEPNENSEVAVQIPSYDKSLQGGRGDRLPLSQWPVIHLPADIVLLEGWCLGFKSLSIQDLKDMYSSHQGNNDLKKHIFRYHFHHLMKINDELKQYEQFWYPFIDAFIHIIANDIEWVYQWRLEAENTMKSQTLISEMKNGMGTLTQKEVYDFVDRFMPMYEICLPQLIQYGFFGNNRGGIPIDKIHRNLSIFIDFERNITKTILK